MCRVAIHYCLICKTDYDCDAPNFICPTINGDENANMCLDCEDKFAEDYQKWYDEENNV